MSYSKKTDGNADIQSFPMLLRNTMTNQNKKLPRRSRVLWHKGFSPKVKCYFYFSKKQNDDSLSLWLVVCVFEYIISLQRRWLNAVVYQ